MHPVFNPVAPYGYLLPNVYLFMADIANPDLFVEPGFVSTSPAFMRNSANHPAGPHGRLCKKNVNRVPLLGAGGSDTICTAVFIRSDSSTACRLCCLDHEQVYSPVSLFDLCWKYPVNNLET